ncbi:MAG: NADH-quinone oxidoreductase subunit [Candidatus Sumerlaeota bacterium]|nr:NADH-quinone oxidoreductase subunit [Candidatus Sumerlaeota bacterium]
MDYLVTFSATSLSEAYVPVLVMLVVAVGFAVINLILSWVVGRRKPTAIKLEPYECGVPTIGSARSQVNVRFYLVALLFLLFDMEIIYIITWAVAVRANAALPGFMSFGMAVMGIYMLILLVGLLYEWKKGALTWN